MQDNNNFGKSALDAEGHFSRLEIRPVTNGIRFAHYFIDGICQQIVYYGVV